MIRQRVNPPPPPPTVYVSPVGNDANDGTTTGTPLLSLQLACDYALYNFDLSPPFAWTHWNGNAKLGERQGPIVQMAPAPSSNPYILTNPLVVDGLGACGPITLRGDRSNPFGYYIQANNTFQGLTTQNGGRLVLEGFAIMGQPNCTLINTLHGGSIRINGDVWCGQISSGAAPLGAAGGRLEIAGSISFWGNGGFNAAISGLEGALITLLPGGSVNVNNAMNYGIMCNMMGGSFIWTEGSPPVFNVAAGSSGEKLRAFASSGIMFDHNYIPGTYNPATDKDATSTVM